VKGAGVEGRRPVAQQVIADPRELREDHADVLTTSGDGDPHQRLDRMMPGDIVRQGRDVVHPVGDGDILVVVEVLADFLEAAVQVADVRNRVNDPLAFDGENESQCGMRRGVLPARNSGSSGIPARQMDQLR